jgi:hypothetical protein
MGRVDCGERQKGVSGMTRITTRLISLVAISLAVLWTAQSLRGAEDQVALLQRTLTAGHDLTDGRYRDLKYRNAQWYGSTFFTGPDWTRVGKDWHHPGQDTPSVRCFVVPRDGRMIVAGNVAKLHLSGDGIRATIRHNERDVWTTEIEGDDAKGEKHELTRDVRRGDRIRFVVHKRGGISCDTTKWDPSLRYEDDDKVFRASEAFAKHLQGSSGWRYEMEVGAEQTSGLPTVYAWTPDLLLRPFVVRPGVPIELTERDALPLLVVADGKDQSGLALAAPSLGKWRCVVQLENGGTVRIALYAGQTNNTSHANWSEPYRGAWSNGLMRLDGFLTNNERGAAFQKRLAAIGGGDELPLAFRAMIQSDWRRQDSINDSAESFSAAAQDQLRRARLLLTDLQAASSGGGLAKASRQLSELETTLATASDDVSQSRKAWLSVRRLKRRIALANPLLDFGPMLVCKRVPPSWSHLVAQYFGWRQRSGGGLYVVEKPGYSLAARDILGDQLPPGSVLEPRLSYDGRRILFAFVACNREVPDPASLPVNEEGKGDRYFHLYEINIDGSGLRQLTDGPYDDMMAEYLPDGGIVFCSSRRKGYSRCFGGEYSRRWHTYTLHRMDADGGNIRTLSYNDVSEWFPAVSNSGHVLHARWDYIDRDAVTHQNLWSIRPDGTNPDVVWGNAAPKPHCTFQAKPIPNSNKIVFIASAHHSITAGPVCVLDPTIDVNSLSAVRRITPLPFPEAEGNLNEWYSAPWPLSEDYFLVAYSPHSLRFQGEHQTNPNPDNGLGVYLLDAAGNRELLYRDPDIGVTNPTPLAPRKRPPVLPNATRSAKQPHGTMLLSDVYQGLGDAPPGTIQSLRIVQVFPKTTWLANQPRMGVAGEENGRAILGTVPVEADGSAYFEVPAGKPILFQALDKQGMAYQTMRSLTFVQPGERTSCVGCHDRRTSPPPSRSHSPQALRRGPSAIEPGELGGRPFGFAEVVQPVLDKHCTRCHGGKQTEAGLDLTGKPDRGFTRSYISLCGTPDAWKPRNFDLQAAKTHLVPRFAQRNQIQVTPPGGGYGARGSRLMKLLAEGHENVELTPAEVRRLAAWIDMNAIFYGVYDTEGQARQLAGERVAMPKIQ